MQFGAAMFFTDASMTPGELGPLLEQRGFESLWVPEHSHVPLVRTKAFPGGPELPRPYYDIMDPFLVLTAAAVATKTLKVGTGVCLVLVTLVTAVPAAYALARLRLPGAGHLGITMFMTYLVPPIIIFLPLARIVGTLGLFDSWWALVVVYPTFTIPFCTWLLMGFFRSLPREIEEAAWVDGCGLVGGILRVVLPLARPGIAIAAIFAFTLAMQESLYAVVYVAPRDQTTVMVGVATSLIRGDIFYWGSLMAAALVVGLPVAILYTVFLDHFIRGLTASGAS
jgi:ABC-type glycerol-3-phosphate transport system permease component